MEQTLVINNEREVTSGDTYLLSVPLDEPCKIHLDTNRAVVKKAREKCEAWKRPPDITLDASLLANIASKLCDDGHTVSLWLSGVDQPIVIAASKGRLKQEQYYRARSIWYLDASDSWKGRQCLKKKKLSTMLNVLCVVVQVKYKLAHMHMKTVPGAILLSTLFKETLPILRRNKKWSFGKLIVSGLLKDVNRLSPSLS